MRLTIRFPDDLAEWIDGQTDAETSKAAVVRRAVRAAAENRDGAAGSGVDGQDGADTAARLTAIEDRLDDLASAVEEDRDDAPERRGTAPATDGGDAVTAPVAASDGSAVTPGDTVTGDRGDNSTDPVTSGDTAAPSGGDTVTDPVTTGDDPAVTTGDDVTAGRDAGGDPGARDDPDPDAEADVSETVRVVVDDVADGWDDAPDRLAARKAAAVAVLEHAVTTGAAVGKTDAIDEFGEEYAVPGQSPETWWRKNVRPVLKSVGDYSRGQHGYRVDLGGTE